MFMTRKDKDLKRSEECEAQTLLRIMLHQLAFQHRVIMRKVLKLIKLLISVHILKTV